MQEGIFDFLKIFREGKRSPPTALRVAICLPLFQEEADRDQQGQVGPLGHHEEALEHILQHEGPGGQQEDAARVT